LDGLKKFASEQHVREAFMQALQNDDNASIRVQAIDALVAANAKDRGFAAKLQEATKQEDNPYINNKVLQYVSGTK